MAEYPALPLWTDAYLADTMHMSVTESGAYLHLLMAAWRSPDCSLPDDDKMLGRMARCTPREWAKVRAVVMNFWTRDEKTKTWSQNRLLKEREYVSANSEKGRRAAEARWLKDKESGDAQASSEHMQEMGSEHMPNACQTDAPIPIPINDDANSARDPACEHIEIFDKQISQIWGRRQERLCPHSTDLGTARMWIENGVTPQICASVCLEKMTSMKTRGRSPPRTLSYFDNAMADAVAASKRPMPEGNPNAPTVRDNPGSRPTKTDRAKAAIMRAAIAGGYASGESAGAAGSGDDAVSVFPVPEALREGTGGA